MNLADFQNLITVAIAFNFAYVFYEQKEDRQSPDSEHPGLWRFFKIFSSSQIENIRNYTPKRIIRLEEFFIGAQYMNRQGARYECPEMPAAFQSLKKEISEINARATEAIARLLNLSGMPKLCLLFGLYGLLLLGFVPVYDGYPIVAPLIFNLNLFCCAVLAWVFLWDAIGICVPGCLLCNMGKVAHSYIPEPRRRYMPFVFTLMAVYAFACFHCDAIPFAKFRLSEFMVNHTPVHAVLIVYSVFIVYGAYFIVAYLLIRLNHLCRTQIVMNAYRADLKVWNQLVSVFRICIVVPDNLERGKFNMPPAAAVAKGENPS